MNEQRPQVIVIKQQSNGCLVTALVFLLFGWIGLAVMAAWKLTKVAWRMSVAMLRIGWQWTVKLSVLTWRATVAGVRLAWPTVQRVSVATIAALRQGSQALYSRVLAITGNQKHQ